MYRNRIMAVLGLLLIASMVLTACQPAPTETQAPTTEENTQTPTEEQATPEETMPQTTRHGGWLDEIGMKVVGADSAITQIAAGDIDIYTSNLSTPQDVEASDAAGLDRSFQFGIYYELTFNPSPFSDGRLNPFTSETVRKAINYLVDRDYINQEVYGGLGVPKYVSFVSAFPDYARNVATVRAVQSQLAFDPDKAAADIATGMTEMGAEMVDGKWMYNGDPVEITFLIRNDSDGTRVPVGDYVASQLESVGFTVTKQYGSSSELSALWVSGDVADGQWNVYTGAWGVGGISRDDAADFQFFDSPDSPYGFTTLWQSLADVIDPDYRQLANDLANSNFTSLEQRSQMMAQAIEYSTNQATRIWLIDGRSFSPWQPNVTVAFDLAAGVDINPLTAFTLRFKDQEGGTLQWGTPDLFVDPANPIGGSNWTYDNQWQLLTRDAAFMLNPYTGIPLPERLDHANVTVQTGLPVGTTYDWVTLNFADQIDVPADAWIDWDPATETFITVGDAYPDGLTALAKSEVVYEGDLFTHTWQDGSQMSPADFVMPAIMAFATGTEGSPLYDDSAAGALEAFKGGFKGWRITSTDPLTIEYYTDVWFQDAELIAGSNAATLWPEYGYGNAPWHSIAVSNMAEAAGDLAYTADKADANSIEWTNYIAGPSLDILAADAQTAADEGLVPFAATLGDYITADEATARYNNLLGFYGDHGHFWVGIGPYILDQVFSVEKTAVLVNNPDFPDLSDKWSGFSAPKIATAEIDGSARITAGDEASFDVYVTYNNDPYPADEVSSVKYLLYDATGAIIETGDAVLDMDGHYVVTLSGESTAALGTGSDKLEVAVVVVPVSIPAFATFDFVTE
jgi:peptide/nickel transport system substrate-binding protein